MLMNRNRQNVFGSARYVALSAGLFLASIPVGSNTLAAERITFYHFDALGSPVAASDEQGNVVWRETYQPYGERIQNQPPAANNSRWYTGHPQDSETGLVYAGARYYDPVIGRFMATDPKGVRESNLQSFNRYAYANNNPYTYIDPDGRDSVVANGQIYITPVDPSVPSVRIPNNVGATGVSSSSWKFHTYNVSTPTSLIAPAAGEGIKNNPTPGSDSPASPTGTVNNAGPILTAGDSNLVRSYSVPSPDPSRYTDITVNHTIAGEHGLNEGYVIRYGEIGPNGSVTLRTYGEGNAMRQSPLLRGLWGPRVDSTWRQNHREIMNGN